LRYLITKETNMMIKSQLRDCYEKTYST